MVEQALKMLTEAEGQVLLEERPVMALARTRPSLHQRPFVKQAIPYLWPLLSF